jgi:signal transduction histidine kinase/DNA-binding NarL/FixJ family response regulator
MNAKERLPLESEAVAALDGAGHGWLSGGGPMSELIAAHDWAATSLGPLKDWPASLRTTVSLCLASNFPINIVWGPDALQIYNSGYRELCGAAHPRAIGESYRVTWASAWPAIGEPFEMARLGETSYLENQRMFLERNGYLEETFFTFSLSPIRDDAGAVAGLFHPVTETTAAVLSERRARTLRDLSIQPGSLQSVDAALRHIVDVLDCFRLDIPFAILYRLDPVTGQLQLASSTGLPADAPVVRDTAAAASIWPIEQVAETGRPVFVDDVVARMGRVACGSYEEPTTAACIVPLQSAGSGNLYGYAVLGLSTRLPRNEAYRAFVSLVGDAMSVALASAMAYQAERRRADELVALDEAKTAFFSNVSHEFRTPLTLMLGPLEDSLSDDGEPLGPGQRLRQQRIHRNALRLLKLVNTLLDFSRIQAGRVKASYRPTDLAHLTSDLASVFRSVAEDAGLSFRVEVEDIGQPVFVDHEMWEKVVLNLLSNAFKFTHQGEIHLRLDRQPSHARLTVRDTGIGIPSEELPRLFERFHRVAGSRGRTYEGSGIGLALVQELVKLHGGTVEATSRAGDGSTFEVLIPLGRDHLPTESLHPAAAPLSQSPMRHAFETEVAGWLPDANDPSAFVGDPDHPPADTVPRTTRRILVVEDNIDMQSYLVSLLQPLGDIRALADGHAALLSIAAHRPDLVISDVMMPGLDGLALLERLRAAPETADIPFVLLSAKAGEESRIEGLLLGADDYLVKPFSARELLARATTQLKLGDARLAARSERHRLREFFVQAQLPMAMLSGPEHRFVLANEPYLRLVGRDVAGQSVAEAFPAQDVALFIPLLDGVYRTGQPYNGRDLPFRVRGKDGLLHDSYLDVSYQPFRELTGEITGIMALVVDVTKQVLARSAIEHTVAQLTEERAIRERFVLTLAHDLRGPLQVVEMASSLLVHQSLDPELLSKSVERIRRNVALADSMICDLLDANRLQAGDRMPLSVRPGDLQDIVATAATDLVDRHGGRIRVRHSTGPVPGLWDGAAIRRVIENLAGNAIKYGQHGGPITLGLSCTDGTAEITVHNEGEPILAIDHAAIFEPFYRLPSAASGSHTGWGVGLTLVRGIAEAHGGTASVHSDAIDGTTFSVWLPIQASP